MTSDDSESIPVQPDGARALTERLARHSASELRYEIKGEIARGGMGAILEVFDGDLRRKLAMKVVRPREGAPDDAAGVDKVVLCRFLEEAQVTAQLSHPGVVPVHELGIDSQGRVFFTMSLVKGHDLKHVFDEVHQGSGDWTQPRALGALLKVCETMAYAHSKGVIHRDLKPANVMVGEFGEVYVMDWGLAKLAGDADRRGLRPDLAAAEHATRGHFATERVTTDRRDAAGLDPSSSLLTMDGTIVGTPSFMSPEQARGEALDHRSDIYAAGAMLYALLTGQNPYAAARAAVSPIAIVQAIHKGPPIGVSKLAHDVSPELVAVCEKAMAREPGARYASMQALADDVRAYLEGRVVKAHATGAWAEFRKWVGRNKGTASALAGFLLAVIGGISVTAYIQQGRAEDQKQNAERERALRLNETAAKERETKAKEDVLRLADVKVARDLEVRQESLWPPLPANAEALSSWVAEAQDVHARLGAHERSLAALTASAPTNKEELWQIDVLKELTAKLEALPALIDRVSQRRDFALTVEERTVTGEDARRRWTEALNDIASLPVYSDVHLTPQLGLLPLESDPQSGLWEFWHVQSGEAPVRDPDTGRWKIQPETGIVLVLLAAGRVTIGSKKPTTDAEAEQPFFDPNRQDDEQFVEGLKLDAFFCSKYETTQSQWQRTMGSNPSRLVFSSDGGGLTHPVETVSWAMSDDCARRSALELPTEAQWEYACRAGTATVFSTGNTAASLLGFANVADLSFARAEGTNSAFYTTEFDDGFASHAPVGSAEPNVFGLFDMHGNVHEWCRDLYLTATIPSAGDGMRAGGPDGADGMIRGGSWYADPSDARCANRFGVDRTTTDQDLGARLVRRVQ